MPLQPRITHVLDNFDIGGAQRMLIRFLENSSSEESSVIAMSRRNTAWEADVAASSIPLQILKSSRLLSPKTWAMARSALRASASPIVHVHMQYSGIVFLPLAKLSGRKTVVTLHNVSDTVDNWRQRLRFRLHRCVIRNFADKVISVGPLVTQAWSKFLPRHDILTIENTVPLPDAAPGEKRRDIRETLATSETAVVVITVASLLPKKDLPTLISAFHELAQTQSDVELWIVGTGPLKESLQSQIDDLGLAAKVKLLGARTDVQDLLFAADIFALSSRIEGLPISMLEAMATRLPVVVPDVGDIRTVVGEECGIVVPAGDASALTAGLAHLVQDKAERHKLGLSGRNKVEQDHSEERWMKQMRACYKELDNAD
ncbi:MAG: glycosyltransferase [Paracoccaceae bacterium]